MPISELDRQRRLRFWRFLENVMTAQAARKGTYNQNDLSIDLGISPGTVSKYRKGAIDPLGVQASIIGTLSRLSNVSVADILSHVAEGTPITVTGQSDGDGLGALANLVSSPSGVVTALRVLAAAIEAQIDSENLPAEDVAAFGPPKVPAWYSELIESFEEQFPTAALLERVLRAAGVDHEELHSGVALEAAPDTVGELLGLDGKELLEHWRETHPEV